MTSYDQHDLEPSERELRARLDCTGVPFPSDTTRMAIQRASRMHLERKTTHVRIAALGAAAALLLGTVGLGFYVYGFTRNADLRGTTEANQRSTPGLAELDGRLEALDARMELLQGRFHTSSMRGLGHGGPSLRERSARLLATMLEAS